MRQYFFFFLFLLPFHLIAQGLPCAPSDGCRCLIEKADAILSQKDGDYQQALYLYFAAQACDESLTDEAEEKILALFEKIEYLRTTAENSALLIQQQQYQLIAEKEAAELATRKAKAQSLNSLASEAILEEDMIEAFRLMQYANAYDPNNPFWLDNCQEVLVRNAIGYTTKEYLNLLPNKIFHPTNQIEGVLKNQDEYISWDKTGYLSAWNGEGIIRWENKYENPIIGINIIDNDEGYLSWDEKGIIRILDQTGSIIREINHGAKPNNVFLLDHNNGFLAWSDKEINTWDLSGNLTYSTEGKKPTFVLKKEFGDGFICSFKDRTVEFWNNYGKVEHSIKIPNRFEIGLYEYSDSLFMTLERQEIKLWNYEGVALDSNYHFEGFIGANPIQDSRRALLWGRNQMLETNIKTYWIGSNPIEVIIPSDTSSFLVWMEDGSIAKYDWEGNSQFRFTHPTNVFQVKFIQQEKEILYATEDGFLYHVDYEDGELISKIYLSSIPIEIYFDSSSLNIVCITQNGTISYWPYNPRKKKKVDFSKSIKLLYPISDQNLLLRYHNKAPQIIDQSGNIIRLFKANQDIWRTYILNEDMDILGYSSDSIFIWDIEGKLLSVFKTKGRYQFHQKEKSHFYCYEFSEGKVNVYNFEGEQIDSFLISPLLNQFEIISDNKFAALDLSDQIEIYDLTKKYIIDSIGSGSSLRKMYFLKEKNYFFCYSPSGETSIWDYKGNSILQKNFDFEINGISFHPNETDYFIYDKTGGLYKCDFNGATDQIIQLDEAISHVEFMSDGLSFITIDRLGNIKCWDQYGIQFGNLNLNYSSPEISFIPNSNAYINRTKYEYFIWSTSPTDILKSGNNIGIPDFTNEEKRKYGIDLDINVDREYMPYPWLRE